MRYVNIDVIKEELNRLLRNYRFYSSTEAKYRFETYTELLEWVDTLEVKEVGEPSKDLEKEIQEVQRNYKTIEEYKGYPCTMYADDIEWIAKHFFELGLKAKKGE